jgi:hypothetical protein
MNKEKLYNSTYEIGVRVLIALSLTSRLLDLQRTAYYDYLMLHYGDIDENYESLHPANPFHTTELYVKRELIKSALDLICKKGLANIKFTNEGFLYEITSMGKDFLECFESDYFVKLRKYAHLVTEKFDELSDDDLYKYINTQIGKWKDEFENESLFRGDNVE